MTSGHGGATTATAPALPRGSASLLVQEGWAQERGSGKEGYAEGERGNSTWKDCAGLKGFSQPGGRRPRAHRGQLGKRAHGGGPATGTVTASWHRRCQDVLQKEAVISFQEGQNAFSQVPPGTTLHSRKPWAAQGSARGVEEPENPHAGKGEVSLARVGTVSLQPIQQFAHFKLVSALTSRPAAASSCSGHGRRHLFCSGPPVERKGQHLAGTPVPHAYPHRKTWSQGHLWPKDSSTSQTWGWMFTRHLARGSFSTLPQGWFWGR